jgi:hypothetical protein
VGGGGSARRLGVTYARRQGWDWPPSLGAGVVNALFGVVIIALEVSSTEGRRSRLCG